MTTHAGVAARHINSYHHNASLLFQFILAEFTEASLEIKRLDSLCNSTVAPLGAKNFDLAEAHSILTKLVGAPRDTMRLFSWNFGEGILTKLKTYCSLLLQSTEADGKDVIAMQHYAEKVWTACLHSIDMFENHLERTAFMATFEKATSSIQRFSKQLTKLFHHFQNDENVIFYVVKHHKIFDKIYGGKFVSKLLGRLYPKGSREALHFLTKQYSARGFDTIVSEIQAAVAEIEAST